jgi:hypothetical protein
VLSLAPGHARLDIDHDEDFGQVSESIRALLHVCRMNELRSALVVSKQDAFDWRSSLRIGIRFAASRSPIKDLRLALVANHFNDGARHDVRAVARENEVQCEVFGNEREALAWLNGAAPAPAVPRR